MQNILRKESYMTLDDIKKELLGYCKRIDIIEGYL